MQCLIIGAGLAGVRAAHALRQAGFDGPLLLLGDELDRPYERPPLSKEVLTEGLRFDEIALHPAQFYEDNRVELLTGKQAVRLEPVQSTVTLDDGRQLSYDRLLIATGSAPWMPAIPGITLPNVQCLRTWNDAVALRRRLTSSSRVVVVGGGLVGMEVASAARRLGAVVTVVEAQPAPLLRLLGPVTAAVVAAMHRDAGVQLFTSSAVAAVEGDTAVERVRLNDGQTIPADLVVIGTGVMPCVEWLRGSGLHLNGGVMVDGRAATNIPNIFAAGDVASTWSSRLKRHVRVEQYGNAHHQGITAANAMLGRPAHHSVLPGASTELLGYRVQSIGVPSTDEQLVVRGSIAHRSFIAFSVRDGRIVAACAVDRARDFPAARRLVSSGAAVDVTRLSDTSRELAAA